MANSLLHLDPHRSPDFLAGSVGRATLSGWNAPILNKASRSLLAKTFIPERVCHRTIARCFKTNRQIIKARRRGGIMNKKSAEACLLPHRLQSPHDSADTDATQLNTSTKSLFKTQRLQRLQDSPKQGAHRLTTRGLSCFALYES